MTYPITRTWAMPSPHTFSIPPIAALLDRWLTGCAVIVDPFSGTSTYATHRNDLNPAYGQVGVDAELYAHWFATEVGQAHAVLFDPPYSPRQIAEVYKSVGLAVGMRETQNAHLYKRVRDALDRCLVPGGIAISCGWNSSGFGTTRGYTVREILLVAHGGAHNDTIVVVEQKDAERRR